MDILFTMVPMGVVLTMGLFLYFEHRAIQANKASKAQTDDIGQKLENYNTSNNAGLFGLGSYIITLILAFSSFDPSYGLIHALLYIFITTFVGSVIIFAIKFKRSILVKVFAAFLYGVPHMVASTFAFLTTYLLI